MKKTVRLFIAFDLPQEVADLVRDVQAGFRAEGVRASYPKPANIHLTLKFLEDTAWEDVGAICSAMSEAAKPHSPIALSAQGVGAFPNRRRPRVLWVGVAGETDSLRAVCRDLNTRLADIGFPAENRPFKGHLTVGRIKGKVDAGRFSEMLDRFGGFSPVPFIAGEMVLYQSELAKTGSIYTRLKTVALSGD